MQVSSRVQLNDSESECWDQKAPKRLLISDARLNVIQRLDVGVGDGEGDG